MTLGEIAQQFLNEHTIPREEALKQGGPIGADTPNPHYYYTSEYMPEETTKHPSGAVRSSDTADVAYHLISPIGLRRVAETCREGELKYSAYNWEKGFPIDDLLNHTIAHIYKFLGGDRSEDHLAHAAWNLLACMHSEELWQDLNIGTLRTEGGYPPTPTSYNLSCTVPQHVKDNYHDEAIGREEEEMAEIHKQTKALFTNR